MDGAGRRARLRSFAIGGAVGVAGAIATARRASRRSRRPRDAPGGLAAFEDAPCFLEVVGEEGGGSDGLVLHLAYATDRGFDLTEVWESKGQFEAFNRDVFPKAMARAGVPMEGPEPELVEFDPVAVIAPRAFTTDPT